jgi:hypothetical protein
MLAQLAGEGWQFVEPPRKNDAPSVIARYRGEPIKAGVRMETITDTIDEMHYKYRSGRYDLEVKIDFEIGRGRVRVEKAEGYDNENE